MTAGSWIGCAFQPDVKVATTMEKVMRYQNLSATVLAACLFITGSAYAQELPDLSAVPNQTPFNYPSGTPISLEKAQALIQAGVAEAKKRGWPEEFAVVDWSGKLVAFARMDGAQLGSIAISEHKARAAAEFRRPTSSFETGVQKYGFNYLLSFDDIIAVAGGIPLVENGKLVGAIGCSGGTTSQDEVLCQAVLGPPYLKNFSTLGN
jgi:glc operon protein GlcG